MFMRFGRNHEMPLDPDVERELAAIDAGLLGLEVAPDLDDLAELARDARAEGPAPESDFAARLDEWAAAGFPRDGRMSDGGEGERGPALGGLRERLRTVPPRRLLLPVGAAATVLVAAAVGISVSDQLGGSSQSAPSIQGVPGTVAESSGAHEGTAAKATAGQATDSVQKNAPNVTQLRGSAQATPFVQSGRGSRGRSRWPPQGRSKRPTRPEHRAAERAGRRRRRCRSGRQVQRIRRPVERDQRAGASADAGARERSRGPRTAGQRDVRAPHPGRAPPGRARRHVEARPRHVADGRSEGHHQALRRGDVRTSTT